MAKSSRWIAWGRRALEALRWVCIGFVLMLEAAILVAGCSSSSPVTPDSRAEFAITATDSVTSSTRPVIIRVEVLNRGTSPVLLGRGSSTCQLDALVGGGGNEFPMSTTRICTADESPQWLQPGESRHEIWEWRGAIRKAGTAQQLPAGRYLLRAITASLQSQTTFAIRVLSE